MVKLNIELPKDFLKEEIRCGYTISTEMKQVWAVELDMLLKLLQVCKKHNIKIFASGGTLLGAIRHKGFVPWDDDIDLMMMRDQYEKLCNIASIEFKKPYFFQTEYSDPGFLRGHAQLRNSETTAILKNEKEQQKYNQGIFIDIFPLDSVVQDEKLLKAQEKKALTYYNKAIHWSRLAFRYDENVTFGLKGVLKKYLHPVITLLRLEQRTFLKYERICAKYNDLLTEQISTLSFEFSNKQHYKFRNDFNGIVDMKFEFLTIPVPIHYEHALFVRFGDYKKFVKGNNCHGKILFDVNKSYRYYLSGEEKI